MTAGHRTPGAAATTVPEWLRPLVAAADSLRPQDFTRFVAPEQGGRQSAVLVLFGSGDRGPTLVVTARARGLRSHPGQPAFPGGRVDPGDDGPIAAALREAVEETGLEPTGVDVLTTLPPLFLPYSASVVTPVVAWWREPSPVGVVDPAEVASVHVIPVAELTDPANRVRTRHPSGYVGPAFHADGLLIWGFTAGLLDRVLHYGGFEQPWDTARVEDLPPDVIRLSASDRTVPVDP